MKADTGPWTYRGGISTLPVQTSAEKAREQYEAKKRVEHKRAIRRELARQGITDVVVR